MTGFTAADVPDQRGRTIFVTGANTGIGFEAALVLARAGGRVLLGCRSEEKARAAMARIHEAVPGADLACVPLDQADLASIARAAELVAAEPRLDVLLNNAGVMVPPLMRTAQGFELQFGVNHLGCFALTGLLLPRLAQSARATGAGARVVVTASIAHRRGRIDWDNLGAEKGYNRADAYAQSKLANLLFLFELDRRLRLAGSPVAALACHPGVAATDLMRHVPVIGPLVNGFFQLVLNTAARGAWPALQAATDPAAQAGEYYGAQTLGESRGVSGPAKRKPHALDGEAARRLWEVSVAMTGVDPGLAAV